MQDRVTTSVGAIVSEIQKSEIGKTIDPNLLLVIALSPNLTAVLSPKK